MNEQMRPVRGGRGPSAAPPSPLQNKKALVYGTAVWIGILITYVGLAIHWFTCPL